jgi:hypothetical protein
VSGQIHVGSRRGWERTDLIASLLDHGADGSELAEIFEGGASFILPPTIGIDAIRTGPDGWTDLVGEFHATWELDGDHVHTVSEVGDDNVLVWTTGSVTARATGASLTLDVRTFFEFSGARICRTTVYWRDTAAARIALGTWTSWS